MATELSQAKPERWNSPPTLPGAHRPIWLETLYVHALRTSESSMYGPTSAQLDDGGRPTKLNAESASYEPSSTLKLYPFFGNV